MKKKVMSPSGNKRSGLYDGAYLWKTLKKEQFLVDITIDKTIVAPAICSIGQTFVWNTLMVSQFWKMIIEGNAFTLPLATHRMGTCTIGST